MNYNFAYINKRTKDSLASVASIPKFSNRRLDCPCFDNAHVLPFRHPECFEGGVMDCDGCYVESSAFYEGQGSRLYEYDKETENDCTSKTAIYIGMLHTVWGHVLTDNLKKVWFLLTPKGKALIADGATIVYVSVWGKQMPSYIASIFKLAGIDPLLLHKIEAPTQFKKVYVPDNSLFLQDEVRYFTQELRSIYSHMASSIPADTRFEKIYLTRYRLKNVQQKEMGEKRIANLFEKHGYVVISPETLSVPEQIALVRGCKYLAVTEGSISHVSVFCQPHTQLTLLRKADIINTWQLAINEIADLNVCYVDAHYSLRPKTKVNFFGPFFMCVTDELERYFGCRTFHLNPPYTIEYMWYLLRYSEKMKQLISKGVH